MKKLSVFVAALLLSANLAFSADITFRLTPGIAIPGNKDYSTGFGGTAQLDLDLFGLLTVGVEGLFTTSNIDALSQSVYFYGGGAGLGFYFYPLSRLYIGLGGAGVSTSSLQPVLLTANPFLTFITAVTEKSVTALARRSL